MVQSSILDTLKMPIRIPSGDGGRETYEPVVQVRICGACTFGRSQQVHSI